MSKQTHTFIEAGRLQANPAAIMNGMAKGACYFLLCESV
jgi:hypothetical protein